MVTSGPTIKELASAVRNNDERELRDLCATGAVPTFRDSQCCFHWLCAAMKESVDIRLLQILIEAGVDPHALPKERQSPVVESIRLRRPDYLRFLLELGVDPNNGIEDQRCTFNAVSREIEPSMQIELLKLLIEHGADLNYLFPTFGDRNNLRTVLDHATNEDVREFLRSNGAKTAAELIGTDGAQQKPASASPLLADVQQHVEKLFGPAEERSFTDLLNPESGISLHVIRPTTPGGFLTLFTLGLSTKPMNVPAELSEHAYAELYMQLPGDWDFKNPAHEWSWPVQLMLNLAAYPHANDAFFAVPVTSIANGEPPAPLGPNVGFTSSALLADEGFTRSDGNTVHLFCVMPIYTEEQRLLKEKGIPTFLNALDQANVSRILTPGRANMAT